jgi:hypothetical protein
LRSHSSIQWFALIHKGKKYYFDRNPIYLITKRFNHSDDVIKYDDKWLSADLVKQYQAEEAYAILFRD